MKKLLSLSFVFLCTALFAENYTFLALGDLHYDGEKYHTSPTLKQHQKQERKRNLAMWESGKSDQLLTAASRVIANDTKFVVQLGDFTQGDCDTEAQQEAMFKDGFARVKRYFPAHKLLAVKGNHDVRLLKHKGFSNAPAEKAFLPLIARELNRERVAGNYAVKQSQDLFIFFDSFVNSKNAINFVEKTLQENSSCRYVFFFTHLPVLPCSTGNPAWTVPARDKLIELLAQRNAIILCAHTHIPGCIALKTPHGSLTQLTVCSMGNQWNPQAKPAVKIKDFAAFSKRIPAERMKQKNVKKFIRKIQNYPAEYYELYTNHSGFAVIKVSDQAVIAEIHADNSRQPWIKKLLQNRSGK